MWVWIGRGWSPYEFPIDSCDIHTEHSVLLRPVLKAENNEALHNTGSWMCRACLRGGGVCRLFLTIGDDHHLSEMSFCQNEFYFLLLRVLKTVYFYLKTKSVWQLSYGLDDRWIWVRFPARRWDLFSLELPDRLLSPNQPRVRWVSPTVFPKIKRPRVNLHLMSKLRMSGTLLPLNHTISCRSMKFTNNLLLLNFIDHVWYLNQGTG